MGIQQLKCQIFPARVDEKEKKAERKVNCGLNVHLSGGQKTQMNANVAQYQLDVFRPPFANMITLSSDDNVVCTYSMFLVPPSGQSVIEGLKIYKVLNILPNGHEYGQLR